LDGNLIMGNIRLYGSTSGYTELAPPAVAPDGVLSLPSGVGTLLTAEGGKVLQVVRATDTTDRTTTSTTYVDVTGSSVTITPQKSTSSIIVVYLVSPTLVMTSVANPIGYFRITDSSDNALSGAAECWFGDAGTVSGTLRSSLNIWGYDTPGSTAAKTYKVRFRSQTSTVLTATRADSNPVQLFAIEVSA
jgi:hypothetical protein